MTKRCVRESLPLRLRGQEEKTLCQALGPGLIAVVINRSREEAERAVSRRGAGRATRGIQVTRSKACLRLEMRNRGTRKPKAVRRGSLANRALSHCTTLQHATLHYTTLRYAVLGYAMGAMLRYATLHHKRQERRKKKEERR